MPSFTSRLYDEMRAAFLILLSVLVTSPLRAQDNYEIQVYGSDTVARGLTMTELHSNYNRHVFHETVEISWIQ